MVVLEILGIVIGVFSAAVGFSYKLYLLLNFRILYADHAYVLLMRDKKLEDRTTKNGFSLVAGCVLD